MRTRRRIGPGGRDRGYAMVAVVAGIGIMAAIAATMIQSTASRIETLTADTEAARLGAAADAGLQIALSGLTGEGVGTKWAIDGRVEHVSFHGVPLDIVVEDERGKVMLNRMDGENMGWLLEAFGVPETQRAIAAASFADWVDQDDQTQDNGVESEYYNPRGLSARNDGPRTVEELGDVRGFTPALVERIAKVATVDGGSAAFDSRFANPIAIRAMVDGRDDSPEIIQRRRELAGQRVAIALDDPDIWKDRNVMIRVTARGSGDARAERVQVVTLTGKRSHPYIPLWGR
ncbi:type II secretion system minor pseudopilin [Novosphingobium huizhouense]|uniref:general secretion pathway protein GspK n=1 Tax=Novosphingobium huizhouense TaxID=2866625 RepID=UPI001CD8E00D|nr:type II secretion system protein GspK [Novosphingobium huizhouense]